MFPDNSRGKKSSIDWFDRGVFAMHQAIFGFQSNPSGYTYMSTNSSQTSHLILKFKAPVSVDRYVYLTKHHDRMKQGNK